MRRDSGRWKRDALILLAAAVLLAGVYAAARQLETGLRRPESRGDLSPYSAEETVLWNGAAYRPRSSLKTFLLMGIDTEEASGHVPGSLQNLSGGQADFLRLIVLDAAQKTAAAIEIDRDTLAPITVLGMTGEALGTQTAQICLAHGFGDGREQSCGLTVQAVEGFLQIPILHYGAVNLKGIPVLNDAVGGVTVTLEDDFSALDPAMLPGTTLTLRGGQAEIFVRSRMTVGTGTNEARMARQQQYIARWMEAADRMLRNDRGFADALLDALGPYLVTDMRPAGIVNEIWKARDYTRLPLIRLAGVHRVGDDGYMEFIADADALRQTVLDVFYQKLP